MKKEETAARESGSPAETAEDLAADGKIRTETFLASLDRGNSGFLRELEQKAKAAEVPVISPASQSVLRTVLALKRPKNILEIGCAVGFSALLMAENTPSGTQITTIEKDGRRAAEAKRNFAEAGAEQRIHLLLGDADSLLGTLPGNYDFIFMDAAKAQYIRWLPAVLSLLKKGGVLLSDNVLQEGDILESHYAVERRNRTIYKRMREYLTEITHNDHLETTVLPVGDGLALSVKL